MQSFVLRNATLKKGKANENGASILCNVKRINYLFCEQMPFMLIEQVRLHNCLSYERYRGKKKKATIKLSWVLITPATCNSNGHIESPMGK